VHWGKHQIAACGFLTTLVGRSSRRLLTSAAWGKRDARDWACEIYGSRGEMFGFGKRLTLTAAFASAVASAGATDLDLVFGPKIQAANEALYNCMVAKTKLYVTESEPATVVASAARRACWAEQGEYRRWFLRVFPAAKLETTSTPRWLKTSRSSLSFVLRRSHAKARKARLQPGP